MGISYTTRQLVLGSGVPRGALVRPAREVAAVDATANVLELQGHGLSDGDAIEFTVDGPGVLPAPLALVTVYYAKLITLADQSTDENRFQVASIPGGVAIDLTDAGTAPFALVVPIGPLIDLVGEMYSRICDQKLPADAVPLAAPYPAWVVQLVTIRTAIEVTARLGREVAPSMKDRETDAWRDFLTMLESGAPLRGDAAAQTSTNTTVVMSAGAGSLVNRGSLP